MNRIIILVLSLFIASGGFTQSSEWRNYTSNQTILDIADDGDNLWVATNGGLFLVDKITGACTIYNNANSGIPDNTIQSLKVASPGVVWVGTRRSGICKFDGKKTIIYNTKNSGLPHDQHNRAINIDSKGNLWVSSLMYLSIFDGQNWQRFETGPPVASFVVIFDIEFDQKGTTWVGAS